MPISLLLEGGTLTKVVLPSSLTFIGIRVIGPMPVSLAGGVTFASGSVVGGISVGCSG